MHDVKLGVNVLLDGPNPTLWDYHTMRETLRFLRKRGQDIPKKDFVRLIKAILSGPPRERNRASLKDEKWAKWRDHQIRLRLHKLLESGVTLPKSAKRVYDRIQGDSRWQPREDRSEEFPYFISSRWVEHDNSGAMEDFANMSLESFIRWGNAQTGAPWECGGGWHVFFENDPRTALKLLKGSAELGAWPVPPWYTALSRLEQAKSIPKTVEKEIAHTLAGMPLEKLSILALQAARWLERARSKIRKKLRQDLWRQIWDASLRGDVPESAYDFDLTLNHAGGILGNVIYAEMADYIPMVPPAGERPGLPKPLRSDFEKIAVGKSPSAKLARVSLAPRLHALYRIDPEWAERTFFSRMDPDDSASFDPCLWEGYLWSPRFSSDLLATFKSLFFKILRNLDQVPERIRGHGPQLFIHMAIPPDRGITKDEAKGVLYSMKPEELADAAWALKNMLQGAGDKAPALWFQSVGPWFNSAWPKRPRDRSVGLSENLALMAIDSGNAFPDVVRAIKDLVIDEKWQRALRHLVKKEEENRLVRQFPDAALTLADKLVGSKRRLTGQALRTLLDAISNAEPRLEEAASFQRLAIMAE